MADLGVPAWIWPVARYMARGLGTTVELSLLATVCGLVLGVLLGTLLAAGRPRLRQIIRLHVEVWRGLPVIVILFFAFFALPAAGLRLTGFQAALIGLTLWSSAVMADNVRGAIQSIPDGQMDGARALGLRWPLAMCLVILPQATRPLLPPTLNMLTSLIHATSVAAQLGVLELLEAGRRSSQRLVLDDGNAHSLAIFAAVLVVFFIVCYPLMALSRWLEHRLALVPGGTGNDAA